MRRPEGEEEKVLARGLVDSALEAPVLRKISPDGVFSTITFPILPQIRPIRSRMMRITTTRPSRPLGA